jgi:colanic acid/amylovoran biosynthesis glycosyltransferase
VKVAYLVNKYPKVSHSFIRREISALEAGGVMIERFSIRSCESELVDRQDKVEFQKTQILLNVGIVGLLLHLFYYAIAQPNKFFNGLRLALQVGWKSDRGILRHIFYLAEACVLRSRLQKLGVTHLHSHFGTNSTTVAMLCHAIGGPAYSFTVHGPEEFDRAANIALTAKIHHAKFVVAISSFGRSQLYRWCEYSQWQKIHIVHCGVDSEFMHQSPPTTIDNCNLVCVGRICEQKGQLLLLEAVKLLIDEGVKLNLTLVGDGPMRSQLQKQIDGYKLNNQVHITGWASGSEVQKYITQARALILPSFAEGLPVVLMEALALKRPVITTYIAGIPELVKPGENGWLIPAGSVEEIVTAIRAVLKVSPDTLERMGIAGTVSVNREYNVTQAAKKLTNLFQDSSEDLQGKELVSQREVSIKN